MTDKDKELLEQILAVKPEECPRGVRPETGDDICPMERINPIVIKGWNANLNSPMWREILQSPFDDGRSCPAFSVRHLVRRYLEGRRG